MAGALNSSLLIACGAADTRAALLIEDEARLFWFGPARGDEGLPRPREAGDRCHGRVHHVSKSLGGSFVDIGESRDGFLPSGKSAPPLVEGEAIVVRVRRPALEGKGAVLSYEAAAAGDARPGPLGAPLDAVLEAAARCGAADAVIVNDPAARRLLEQHLGCAVSLRNDPFAHAAVEDAIEGSLESDVALDAGARLHFHETAAGCVIDVDAAAFAGRSGLPVNDRVNAAAAHRLFPEISRRALGGRIIVDFLPPSGAKAKASLADALQAGVSNIDGARFGRMAPDGLFDFTAPRRGASLLTLASEPDSRSLIVKGRRLTLDWSAKAAMRALEGALTADLARRCRLVVGEELAAYLVGARPQWRARLEQKFGARFTIDAAPSMEPRAHAIL